MFLDMRWHKNKHPAICSNCKMLVLTKYGLGRILVGVEFRSSRVWFICSSGFAGRSTHLTSAWASPDGYWLLFAASGAEKYSDSDDSAGNYIANNLFHDLFLSQNAFLLTRSAAVIIRCKHALMATVVMACG